MAYFVECVGGLLNLGLLSLTISILQFACTYWVFSLPKVKELLTESAKQSKLRKKDIHVTQSVM